MIHVFTLKYGDRYKSELVNDLFDAFNYPDVQFYCYTENRKDLNSAIHAIDLKFRDDIFKHWYKIDFFQKNFVKYQPGDQCIILDIDQVVVDNIEPLLYFETPANTLVTYKPWYESELRVQGGFYKFNCNEFSHIYDRFYSDPARYQTQYYNNGDVVHEYYGEQNFVDECVESVVHMPEEWYCGRHTISTARIIHYNGPTIDPL